MQIEICGREIKVSERLHDHIERRVHFALERFAERIRKVRVQVRDFNGPRGGVDKNCQLVISLVPASTVVSGNPRHQYLCGHRLSGGPGGHFDHAPAKTYARTRPLRKNLEESSPGGGGPLGRGGTNLGATNHE